jgi:hypothetical protein
VFFIGRTKESNRIIKLIGQQKNVIVKGKYGIGRTSLINHVAAITRNRWRFIMADFSLSPAQAEQALLSKWIRPKKPERKLRPYKPARLLINYLDFEGKPWVIVLDNMARLSAQKRAFIRRLNQEERVRFIAIVEDFLPERELFLLRKELIPAEVITLRHLSVKAGDQLFRYFSGKYRFDWSDNHIKMLASATHGYPLGIREIVREELERLAGK